MMESSWRIDRHSPTSPGTYGVVQFEEGQPYEHVGVLVPDDRPRAIADAWDDGSPSQRETLKDWPELYDALIKEVDDE